MWCGRSFPELKAAGAEGIIELSLNKVVSVSDRYREWQAHEFLPARIAPERGEQEPHGYSQEMA